MKKNLKKQRSQKYKLSKACQFFVSFIYFFCCCEIWALAPSSFGTPLRPHYSIFSPQIMQENLTLSSVKKTKVSMRKIRCLISRFFCIFLWIYLYSYCTIKTTILQIGQFFRCLMSSLAYTTPPSRTKTPFIYVVCVCSDISFSQGLFGSRGKSI